MMNLFINFKDLYKPKCQYIITKREEVGPKNFNDPKTFPEDSNDMKDVQSGFDLFQYFLFSFQHFIILSAAISSFRVILVSVFIC